MANCVITHLTNTIRLEFNDQSTKSGDKVWIVRKANCSVIKDHTNRAWLQVEGNKKGRPLCTIEDESVIKVDTVDGVAPTDVDDLIDKLEALL